ncbi:MAG TPA: hypothetical protein VHO07_27510, partial [Streptosporangiaceae bacterium]|nr:hypothetical protein [Streptosporangiaceae bacterium]
MSLSIRTVVCRVEVSHVERDVPVPLAQRGLRGCARFAARRRAGPLQQLQPVAIGRVDEHLDAQVDRVDPERELGHQPEHIAEPCDGRREVGDRQPDVVEPGRDGALVSHGRSARPGQLSGT